MFTYFSKNKLNYSIQLIDLKLKTNWIKAFDYLYIKTINEYKNYQSSSKRFSIDSMTQWIKNSSFLAFSSDHI